MDYQSRYNAIRGDMADEASLLKWQADEGFQDWLRDGPLTLDRHTITRTGHRQATVIEPDGTVFANILFGPACPDTLEAMLAWHRKGKPKPDVYEPTDRERIDALTRRVEVLEKLLTVSEPPPMAEEPPVQVGHMDEPNDLEIPRFLAPSPVESVPTDLQALAEPGETVEQTRSRLWALYRELQNKIMMALASREEVRLHERLHIHMGWLAAADERDF